MSEFSDVMESNMKKYLPEIDIVKGVCITTIVMAHAGFTPLWFGYFFVYGFYFVAGFTFSDKPFLTFTKQKILRLYVPFVIAHLISIAVYYIQFAISSGSYPMINDIGGYLFDIIRFNAARSITAASWYLFPLTLILFSQYVVRRLVKSDTIILGATVIAYCILALNGNAMSKYIWNDCAWITNTVIGSLLFSLGHYLKEHKRIYKKIFEENAIDIFLIDSVVLLYLYKSGFGIDIRPGYISNYVYNSLVLIFGIHFLWVFAKILVNSNIMKKFFIISGKYSLQIMLYHVMAFFPATVFFNKVIYGGGWPLVWSRSYADGLATVMNILLGLTLPILGVILMQQARKSARRALGRE